MSTIYSRNLRLIGPFRAETQTFQNDLFSNFDLKFLFCRCSDFVESFFEKSPFLWSIGNLKNIAVIALSAPVKNKKTENFGHFY